MSAPGFLSAGRPGDPLADPDVRAVAARPRRFGAWYVLEHQLLEVRSYGAVTIAQAIGTPLLSWLAYGVGIGVLVTAGTGGAGIDGVPYLDFVFPALMCGLALQIWADEAMFGTMLGISWRGTFKAMRAAPISIRQIAAGFALGGLLRVVLTTLLYWIVAQAAGAMPWGTSVGSVGAALLGATAFGLPLAAYSAMLRSESGQFSLVNRFLVLPLTLLSGTMFPLTTMPIWLQWIGWISPLWHGSQLARDASIGTAEPGWLVVVHIGYLVALVVAGWLFLIAALRRKLER